MTSFVVRRVLHGTLLLVLISIASFTFLEAAPGTYVDEIRLNPQLSASTLSALKARYGLDKPLPVRYLLWLASVLRGEFGVSLAYGMPAGRLLWPRVRNTLILAGLASMLSWMAALATGVFAAIHRGRWVRNVVRASMSILLSVPDLLVALALLMFAVRSGLYAFDGSGQGMPAGSAVGRASEAAAHLLLPVLALALINLPVLVRHVEAMVREAAASAHIQAARALGIPEFRLMVRYVLPAAANPLISLFGFSIGALLSTSLLVEVIMGWPGLGPMLLEAVFSRDVHIIIGATLLSALLLICGNLVADILLAAVDPRIRLIR